MFYVNGVLLYDFDGSAVEVEISVCQITFPVLTVDMGKMTSSSLCVPLWKMETYRGLFLVMFVGSALRLVL